MVELIVAGLVAGSTPGTNRMDPNPDLLRVRAYADRQVDEGTVRPALEVAEQLLASAGLVMAWRRCDSAQSCPAEDTRVPEIVVILSSRDHGLSVRLTCFSRRTASSAPSTRCVLRGDVPRRP